MNSTIKSWLAPSAVALVFAIMGTAGSYAVMAEQVRTNTASITIISESLAALAGDKVAELTGRKAVLEHKANQPGGLTDGEKLEYDNIVRRLKALGQ